MRTNDDAVEKVNESKIRKPTVVQEKRESHYEYKIGDRVNLLVYDDFGIIYKEKDNFYNVVVYYNGELVEVNVKRITLEVAAKELYPEGYDLNTLFVDYKERKMQHDIERGSKKALRKIQKEIRKNRG
ncbi:endonuclease MutS2, partial [Bacillus thuringiensis]|nr:endonuclease MutS2 [Bacillus thuringiensis]